jgi:hypothetical protein
MQGANMTTGQGGATNTRIGQLGGQIIFASAEDVPDFEVDEHGNYRPRHLKRFWRA